ncbi:MAG: MFS transporter [Parvibaculum sp.]|uniref:MFS transporter n=1 Tax=Parvibaculum sp. TaxID=2024848 RepID=UPI003C78321D
MEASEGSAQAWWASIDHRRPAVLFLVALAGSYGMLFASMLPALVNTWLVHLKLTEQVAGLIATANILAATVGLGVSIVLVSRWPLVRIARVGIAVAATGDIASIFAASAAELGALRILAGFGLGLLAGAMTNWFGRHEHAERGFGISVMLQFVLTAVLFALIPVIEPWFGDASIYVALLALGLAAILLSPLFNLNGGFAPLAEMADGGGAAGGRTSLPLMVLAVLAFALFELAVVGLWSYMLRYAELSGLSSASAARVLALSSLCGIPGTVLVLVFGSRYGRWRPLLASLAAYVLPTLVLALSSASSLLLIVGLVLQNIAWAIAVPYFQAVQACLDRSGRLAIWGMLVASAGAGLGPALLGAAIDGGSFAVAFGAVAMMLAVSALFAARPAIVADRIEP